MAKNKIKNWAINVDKLKVCLNISDEIYEYLSENYTRIEIIDNIPHRFIEEDDFFLVFSEEEETKMKADLNVRDVDGFFRLGTFVFHCGKKYKNKAFFSFENSALYRTYMRTNDYPVNHICDLLYVMSFYNMTFNNITEIEVAFDTNYNFIKKTRKMIKDIEKYDLYLNGKKVKDNDETLDGYGEYYNRTRLKMSKAPTLYFSQTKKTDMKMKVYDKAKELQDQSQHKEERYKNWLGWDNFNEIYRVEIVLHNTNVREFIDRYGERMYRDYGEHENVLRLLDFRDFRLAMFLDSCDRLIYFKDKKTQEKISLLEIADL